MITATTVLAQAAEAPQVADQASLGFWLVLLVVLALAPFVFTMVTCFAKLVIIGGIIRQALGLQQIPPNTVITGIAMILTLHVMSPVAIKAMQNYNEIAGDEEKETREILADIQKAVAQPLREFLTKHAHPRNIALFEGLQARLSASDGTTPLSDAAGDMLGGEDGRKFMHDLVALAPAFVLSELIEAFQIGFLIFLPFLIIDLVVGNILLAMGMHMMSPITISLPLKLLLFVLVDGWETILSGLVLGYA